MAVMTTFFPTGLVIVSEFAQMTLHHMGLRYIDFVARHVSADWGDVTFEQEAENHAALQRGGTIVSLYELDNPHFKLSIHTDESRELTRVAMFFEGELR